MDTFEVTLDKIFYNYTRLSPGAAISIIKNGEAYTKCYGIANMENNTPVKTNTNFRLASITKAFTAMCIMILHEKGKLSYSNSLRDIIPEFPLYANKITIKQMLQHTSGIARSIVPDQYPGQLRDRDVLKLHLGLDTPEYEPGTKMQYSNDAYVLLGKIVEIISGLSFSDFMDRKIFKKIGMKNSILHNEGVTQINNRAYGYTKFLDDFGFCDQSQTSLVLGDGGVYSNLDDMFLWDQALYSDVLVSKDTIEQAFKPGELRNGEKIKYGYGWHLDESHGLKVVRHGGSTNGFRNLILRIPEKKYSIILLTNRNEVDLNLPKRYESEGESGLVKLLIEEAFPDIKANK